VYLCVVDVVLSSSVVVLEVLIAIVYQSVWAHKRWECIDQRCVVRTGRWDQGEISSHLLQFTGTEGFRFVYCVYRLKQLGLR
jgi:hypothetical protein